MEIPPVLLDSLLNSLEQRTRLQIQTKKKTHRTMSESPPPNYHILVGAVMGRWLIYLYFKGADVG